ncbi:cytochrome P450, partial [Hysterangium stoloniferum]
LPGYRPLFSPVALPGAAIPRTSWNLGHYWQWEDRFTSYFNYTHDVISIVPALIGVPYYYTSSLEVLRQVLGNEAKLRMFKPKEMTLSRLLGDSIASVSGDAWRRHRRIVAPAFNPRTYSNVRHQSSEIYREMVQAEKWEGETSVSLQSVNTLMLKVSLMIVARCGFGLPIRWSNREVEQVMSIADAISIAAESLLLRVMLPSWAFKLPISKLREIDVAWKNTEAYMINSIRACRESALEGQQSSGDLLQRLAASYERDDKLSLNESEVMANMFTIMFAGHETTAGAITATLILLAIHQNEQEEAYREILKFDLSPQSKALEDPADLSYLQACFREALRLYPAAYMLPRQMEEDVVVRVRHPVEKTITLVKGTRIMMDLIAIHRNPHYFERPHDFVPTRWEGVSEPDVSMFGAGPRACVGRRFAHTEAVCFLMSVLRDWKIDIILSEGETRMDYAKRAMGRIDLIGTALSISPAPLKLTKRTLCV